MYNEIVMDHFTNPRNIGELEDADAVGQAGDPNCGDYIKLYLKIKDNVIEDVKYKVHGCPGAIATTSVYTELIKGKHLEDAAEITEVEIQEALEYGLPPEKIHCSYLAGRALHAALIDYIIS